ncbi:hypothetical protein [Sulfurovum sp. TSL1]|uniref:hypothetical protein n=1 Tax=Sulfurovum sp. TSL1 TaxID=2826994 RepID=UPI001CC4766E|nr:hypothetical protein [Sulfurovum sp. TSL1]GIT98686.1 hypothetical protein TSL1_15070 [Sulfurovum sp. TSL1]
MKILLININPVVSRLLALCTRNEHILLDEVVSADAVDKVSYDIVFVDEASYVDEVQALLKTLEARKKVFISYAGEAMKGFDATVKKPFLPSQIINMIESIPLNDFEETKENIVVVEEDISMVSFSLENEEAENGVLEDIFPLSEEDEASEDMLEPEEDVSLPEVLNRDEIAKIKALLHMDDEMEENEDALSLSDDEYEARKVKVIKEQLIAEGLEIVEEDEIVEELSNDVTEEVDGTPTKTKQKKEETGLSEEELFRIEEAIMAALAQMKPKKIKKLLKGKETKIKIKLEDDQ